MGLEPRAQVCSRHPGTRLESPPAWPELLCYCHLQEKLSLKQRCGTLLHGTAQGEKVWALRIFLLQPKTELDPGSGRMCVRVCREESGGGKGRAERTLGSLPSPRAFPGASRRPGRTPGVFLPAPANRAFRSCPTALVLKGGVGARGKGMAVPRRAPSESEKPRYLSYFPCTIFTYFPGPKKAAA